MITPVDEAAAKYAEQLGKIPHFERHPQMVPWVGCAYDGPKWKRMLLVGESHYLPPSSRIHLDTKLWYESRARDLTPKERGWTSIREIIGSGENQRYDSRAHRIYAELEHVLIEIGFERRKQVLDYTPSSTSSNGRRERVRALILTIAIGSTRRRRFAGSFGFRSRRSCAS